MWEKTTIGLRRRAVLQIVGEPGELLGAEIAEPAAFEIDDIDEADEMHAGLIEGVPAGAFRPLAVAVEIGLAVVVIDDVVFARDIMRIELRRADELCRIVELVRPSTDG